MLKRSQRCHLWQCNMCGEDVLVHIHSGAGVIIVNSIKLPSGQIWISRTGSFVYVGYCYILKWALCCWLSLVIALVMLWNLQDGIIQLWLLFFKVVATSEWVWSMSAHWCSYRTWAAQEGNRKRNNCTACVVSWRNCTHSTLHPPFLLTRFSYKYGGGAYNWIMVISLAYTPTFLAVERARETAMAELSVTISCGLRWSL